MAFISSLDMAASALSAQRLRIDIDLQNIAHQEDYNTEPGGDPYCRQLVVFSEKKQFSEVLDKYAEMANMQRTKKYDKGTYYLAHANKYKDAGVMVAEVIEDDAPFVPVYDPTNPLADEDGYIYKSNVDNAKEQMDLIAAQRSYEANISAMRAVQSMLSKAMTLTGK